MISGESRSQGITSKGEECGTSSEAALMVPSAEGQREALQAPLKIRNSSYRLHPLPPVSHLGHWTAES